MENTVSGWSIDEVASLVGGTVGRTTSARLLRPVPAGWSDPQGITFADNQQYLQLAESEQIGAIFVTPDLAPTVAPYIQVASPRQAFAIILNLSYRAPSLASGVHQTAIVDPSAFVDASASIGPNCVVGPGVTIGPRAKVHAFCYLGDRSTIGADSVIYPSVVIMPNVQIGESNIIHSGAVIGADGFGFAWDGSRYIRIPQVGGVNLGANVEVGANACVDNSTCGDTLVGDGTKLDNLVQIAHNCRIGMHTVIASQTGMAGSVKIGSNVVMGGQVAIRDHATIGDGVSLAGRVGIIEDVLEPGGYFGTPAMPAREGMRIMKLTQRLPELLNRIKKLEAEIEKLKGSS